MWAVDNPIIVRELRVRMRGNRALWMQAAYVGVLSVVLLLGYWQASQRPEAVADGQLGQLMFAWLSVAQGLLLCLMVPALAAGAISAEYEQQTLDNLFASSMSTSRLFWGKLVASSLFVGQLLTTGLPLMALCYLLGGVSMTQLLGVYAVQVSACLVLSAIGLGCSLHCRNTILATTASYVTVIGYVIFTSAVAAGTAALGAVSPLVASSADDGGIRLVAVAVGFTLAIAFLTLDFSVCRARLLRDGLVSWRPRLWLAAVALGLVTWSHHDSASDAPGLAVLLGILLALLLVSGDDGTEPRRRVLWWQFWRHAPESAPLFVALATMGMLLAGTDVVKLDDHPLAFGACTLAVLMVAAVTRAFHTAAGRVWPARFMAVTAVCVGTLLISASTVAQELMSPWEGFNKEAAWAFSLAQMLLYAWISVVMLYLMWRRRVFAPR